MEKISRVQFFYDRHSQTQMSLLVIAYPELTDTDFKLIQDYRKDHGQLYYKVVKPHVTLIFPVTGISSTDLTSEIRKQLKSVNSISFSIRCSTINKDAFSEYYNMLLVPDEGFSQIVKLHDKLYSDKLFPYQRLDIDFIPHIGIGNSTDKMICKKMVDEWNAKNFVINGIISTVEVVNYENETITTVEKIKLNGY